MRVVFCGYWYVRVSHPFFCHIDWYSGCLTVGAELFSGAVEETDELLNGKVIARAEKIEVDKDIDIDERRR